MQPLPPCFSLRAPLLQAIALLALGGLLAACDRHSAAEVPESYGHGSSHQKSYTDHEVDSRRDSRSISDTQGVETGKEAGPAAAAPTATPSGTAPGHFFPSGT